MLKCEIGKIIVFVIYDVDEVVCFGDCICVFGNGIVQQYVVLEEIFCYFVNDFVVSFVGEGCELWSLSLCLVSVLMWFGVGDGQVFGIVVVDLFVDQVFLWLFGVGNCMLNVVDLGGVVVGMLSFVDFGVV